MVPINTKVDRSLRMLLLIMESAHLDFATSPQSTAGHRLFSCVHASRSLNVFVHAYELKRAQMRLVRHANGVYNISK